MQTSRRKFLKNIGLGVSSLGLFGFSAKEAQANIEKKLKEVEHLSPAEVAKDECFWFHVQQAFDIDRSIINLNNGGVHPAPKIAIDAVHRYLDCDICGANLHQWMMAPIGTGSLYVKKEKIKKTWPVELKII